MLANVVDFGRLIAQSHDLFGGLKINVHDERISPQSLLFNNDNSSAEACEIEAQGQHSIRQLENIECTCRCCNLLNQSKLFRLLTSVFAFALILPLLFNPKDQLKLSNCQD